MVTAIVETIYPFKATHFHQQKLCWGYHDASVIESVDSYLIITTIIMNSAVTTTMKYHYHHHRHHHFSHHHLNYRHYY